MKKSKIFILLPDGVGLRNFAFSQFHEIGNNRGYEIVYWNNTPFNIDTLGFHQLKINNAKVHPLTTILKNARKNIELNLFKQKFKDEVYDTYKFSFSTKGLKNRLKSILTKTIIHIYNTENQLKKIIKYIEWFESSTSYYQNCLQVLKVHQPKVVFCTNQRSSEALAPLLAAKKLGIPTVSFIFSWDNLPKATMVVHTDYYFVWSEYMKKELKNYYPYIIDSQIKVTGTPQFETHYNTELIQFRNDFFKQYHLDETKKYICFSGDDLTTSPFDPQYLEDTARAVRKLNNEGQRLGIIFRRCPVDHSTRFDQIINDYNDVINPINPQWKALGKQWNQVMPLKEDNRLLVSTVYYSDLVINVGSSMVFDFVTMGKPCIFINYNADTSKNGNWDIHKIYHYIHFRSMPSKEAVLWCFDKKKLSELIKDVIDGKLTNVEEGKKWFTVVAGNQPTKASENLWKAIETICT